MGKFGIPRTFRMTDGEYRANVQGLNVVFGAVLGFVLAGAEAMTTTQFTLVLLLSISIVVSIFYLESSPYPAFYALVAVVGIFIMQPVAEAADLILPDKLQPTLALWVAISIVLEFAPRDKPPATGKG